MTAKFLLRLTLAKAKEKQSLTITVLLLFWALAFGIVVRLIPLLGADFPLNDGGLFYRMASDLIESRFRLPPTTSFNGANIPFAYPPLGLYILAFLAQVFPLLGLIQWLPFIYSLLAIPAFYLLARTVLDDPIKAGLATVAFALVPSSTDILLWGGGVTRGLGFIFCILASRQFILLLINKHWKTVIPTSLFAALVVLTHPSAAFVTVLFALVFWLVYGRSVQDAARAAAVGGLTLLLTTPWWITVLQNHGLQTFLTGLGSGWYTQWFIPFLKLNTTQEPFMTLVMAVAAIGLVHALYRRRFLLPLWFVACLLSQRDGYVYATLPVSLLFSSAVFDLLVPGLAGVHSKEITDSAALFTGGARWFTSFFLIYSLVNSVVAAGTIKPIRVTPAERDAMA